MIAKRRSIRSLSRNRPPPSPTRPPPDAVRNRLLAALPQVDRERLLHTFEVVPLKLKDLLHKPGEAIEYVYFPGGGFCSLVTVLEDGGMVEVATIGREGMVGVHGRCIRPRDIHTALLASGGLTWTTTFPLARPAST